MTSLFTNSNPQRPSTNDEASLEAGPQAEASLAGIGSRMLADREGRIEGEAASADLPTNSNLSAPPPPDMQTDTAGADSIIAAPAPLNSRSWTEAEKIQVAEYAAAFMTSGQIAKKFEGRSRSAIAGLCNRLGIKLHGSNGGDTKSKKPSKRLQVLREPNYAAEPDVGISTRRDAEAGAALPAPAPIPRKALHELESGDCKWPIGDPRENDFGFCAQPEEGGVYCGFHSKLAYLPVERRPVRRAA